MTLTMAFNSTRCFSLKWITLEKRCFEVVCSIKTEKNNTSRIRRAFINISKHLKQTSKAQSFARLCYCLHISKISKIYKIYSKISHSQIPNPQEITLWCSETMFKNLKGFYFSTILSFVDLENCRSQSYDSSKGCFTILIETAPLRNVFTEKPVG